jgi:hypothetical protein
MTRPWTALIAAAVIVAAAACGTVPPPGQAVPALRSHLSSVNTALANNDASGARRALDALTRETSTARDAGRLTPEQADRILAAAARLAADLPPDESGPPTTVTVEVPGPTGDKNQDRKKGDRKEEEKKKEQGDGHNSNSGPDDGHGN